MFQVGPLELVLVLVIALLVLGPQRLPDVARSVGRGMREFRNAINMDEDDEQDRPKVEPPAQVPPHAQAHAEPPVAPVPPGQPPRS